MSSRYSNNRTTASLSWQLLHESVIKSRVAAFRFGRLGQFLWPFSRRKKQRHIEEKIERVDVWIIILKAYFLSTSGFFFFIHVSFDALFGKQLLFSLTVFPAVLKRGFLSTVVHSAQRKAGAACITRVTILLLWSSVQDFRKQPNFLRLECTGEISGLYTFQSKKKQNSYLSHTFSYFCISQILIITGNFAELEGNASHPKDIRTLYWPWIRFLMHLLSRLLLYLLWEQHSWTHIHTYT